MSEPYIPQPTDPGMPSVHEILIDAVEAANAAEIPGLLAFDWKGETNDQVLLILDPANVSKEARDATETLALFYLRSAMRHNLFCKRLNAAPTPGDIGNPISLLIRGKDAAALRFTEPGVVQVTTRNRYQPANYNKTTSHVLVWAVAKVMLADVRTDLELPDGNVQYDSISEHRPELVFWVHRNQGLHRRLDESLVMDYRFGTCEPRMTIEDGGLLDLIVPAEFAKIEPRWPVTALALRSQGSLEPTPSGVPHFLRPIDPDPVPDPVEP